MLGKVNFREVKFKDDTCYILRKLYFRELKFRKVNFRTVKFCGNYTLGKSHLRYDTF